MKRAAAALFLSIAIFLLIPLSAREARGDNAWLDANGIVSSGTGTPRVALNGSAVANATYWMDPPFLTSNVKPNIMIMLDNSGSMDDHPFTTTYDPTQFASGYYYGYFDPTHMYQYNATSKMWQIYTGPDPGSAYSDTTQPIASGNLLNWAVTRKMEVAKKLLVGGNPGVISTVANPRVVTAPNTVKLYTEDAGSSNNVSFDNSSANAVVTSPTYTYYLVPGYGDVIYPFHGNYTYKLGSGGCSSIAGSPPCSSLSITPKNVSTSSTTAIPSGDLSVSANWEKLLNAFPYYKNVNDIPPTNDGDTTYIQNRKDTTPALFTYPPVTPLAGSIQDVNVVVVAKEVADTSSPNACGTKHSNYVTRNIQAVLQLGGTNYASTFTSLTGATNYNKYTFTWSQNPANCPGGVCQAWQWSDITTLLNGFGVQNQGNVYNGTAQSCYVRTTQVYLYIDATTPSGGPYSLVVDTGSQRISGILDSLSSGVRLGLAQYAASTNGGKVWVPVDFNNMDSIADRVIKTDPNSNTPLAETEYELLRYYGQFSPAFTNTPADYVVGMNTSNDPFYYKYSTLGTGLSDAYVPCAKSYIILLTDGEPTADNYKSPYPFGSSTAQVPTATSNTNGLSEIALWGRGNDIRPGSCSDSTSAFPCIPAVQNVSTYTIFLFGHGSTLLQQTAINGAFEGDPVNNLPPCENTAPGHPTQDELKLCYKPNMPDGTVNLTPPAGTDPPVPIGYYEGSDAYELQTSVTAAFEDIMRKAAAGTSVAVLGSSWKGEGALYQAYFYPEKVEGVRSIKWTGYFRALFVDRYGLIHEDTDGDRMLVPNSDRVINFIFNSGSDTQVQYFWDRVDNATGAFKPDGLLDSSTPALTTAMSDLSPVWDAGKLLAYRDPADRTLYTSLDNSALIPFISTGASDNSTQLRPYLRVKTDPADTAIHSVNADKLIRFVRGEQLSGWRDRQLTVDGALRTWKLGDIVFSDPVVSSAPKERYDQIYASDSYSAFYQHWKYRRAVVYVGSNDGVMHAFNAGFSLSGTDDPNNDSTVPQVTVCEALNFDATGKPAGCQSDLSNPLGKELWGFIPYDLLPHLAWQTDPDYQHVYGVDLMPRITDAQIFPNDPTDTTHVQGWGTIMIVGLRMGGGEIDVTDDFGSGVTTKQFKSAYYALDITDPEHPALLWRFTDDELGFTSSVPAIIREDGNSGMGAWYVVFGSGPSNYRGGRVVDANIANSKFTRSGQVAGLSGMATTNAYLYVLDLKTGQPVTSGVNAWTAHPSSGRTGVIKFPETNAFTAGPTASDYPLDFKFDMIYVGTTLCPSSCDVLGVPSSGSPWSGNMYRIKPVSTDPGQWLSSLFFSPGRPVTTKPSVAIDSLKNIWVYFGTGRFLHIDDRLDTSSQAFYGIKDPAYLTGASTVVTGGPLTTNKNFFNGNSTDVLNGTLPDGSDIYPTIPANTITGQTSKISTFQSLTDFMKTTGQGWFIPLSDSVNAGVLPYQPGERVTVNGFVLSGIAGFGTYTPSTDPCSFEGSSLQYYPYYLTGTAYQFDSTAPAYAVSGVSTLLGFSKRISSGSGMPSAPAVHIDAKGNAQLFIQQSTGAITVIQLPTANTVPGGFGAYKESYE